MPVYSECITGVACRMTSVPSMVSCFILQTVQPYPVERKLVTGYDSKGYGNRHCRVTVEYSKDDDRVNSVKCWTTTTALSSDQVATSDSDEVAVSVSCLPLMSFRNEYNECSWTPSSAGSEPTRWMKMWSSMVQLSRQCCIRSIAAWREGRNALHMYVSSWARGADRIGLQCFCFTSSK